MERKKKYNITVGCEKSRELGAILKELRLKQGLSLRAYGEKCGIGYKAIEQLEKAINRSNVDALEKLANTYGLTLTFTLLPKEKPQPTLNEQDAEVGTV